MKRLALLAAAPLVLLGACGDDGSEVESEAPMTITVESAAFSEGAPIPDVYSCRGRDVSPPLSWSGAPEDAAALALVVDDPDAPRGTYTHWVVLDIDPATTTVDEGSVPAGATQAKNSAGNAEYMGPCPPSGTHRYRFTVYALSMPTGLGDGADLGEALGAISSNAVAQGRLTGTFAAG